MSLDPSYSNASRPSKDRSGRRPTAGAGVGRGRGAGPGITPREWLVILRSTLRVLRDSGRIADIHRAAEITSRGRFEALLADALVGGRVPQLLREQPELDPASVDLAALRRLPADTLGGAYVRHLDMHRLKMFVDPTPRDYVDDPDVRYLIHRYRQVHDIWHVLLGLGTRGHEEVLVHAFVLGHLGLPISALIVLFGTLKHVVMERRWTVLRHTLLEAYRSGRSASPLLMVRWEQQWSRPLHEVRRRYRIRPCMPARVEG